MIQAPLSLHLLASDPLTALIGLGHAARLFEGVIPQKQASGLPRLPAVLIRDVAMGDRQVTFCGTVGTSRADVSVDCYDVTPRGAWAIAEAVRGALLDFRGVMGGTLQVRACSIDAEIELQDLDPGLYRVSQTWAIWFLE
jgi:hypothetical protein